MSEEQGTQEAIATVQYLKEVCAAFQVQLVVYLNPTYIARDSPLEKEMKQRGYTPPNYQSIFQVISESQQFVVPIYVGLWDEGLATNINTPTTGKEINAMRRALKVFNSTQNFGHLAQSFKEERINPVE
ncbi:MAG: hypothetical protein HY832_03300 [Candidatus Aenigmarchaeota archaeon]|nr:hypothetical protein [Candidatus Aenigmarchaeota archaeon]